MSKILYLLAFITSFVFVRAKASDTIKINKTLSLDNIGVNEGVDYLLIRNKSFLAPFTSNMGFFNYFTYPKDKFSQVYFRTCYFNVFDAQSSLISLKSNEGFYVIDSCDIDHLHILNTSGRIAIASSKIEILNVEKTNNLDISLTQNKKISHLRFDNNRNLKLHLYNSNFKDSSNLNIYNSSISEFTFIYNENSGCNAYFQNDTINSFISGSLYDKINDLIQYKEWYKYENNFTFQNCHINAGFIFFEHIPNSTIIFNNCTFGENLGIGDLAIDKLVFRNCKRFPLQTYIGFREQEKDVKLQIVNTNIDNLSFEFLPNIILDFDSTDGQDIISNSYKNLMDKFESEGKSNSYMNIDLQYRKYSDSKITNLIKKMWWGYGYKQWYVFLWTLSFIILFLCFNVLFRKQIFETYNLNSDKTDQIVHNNISKKELYAYTLIFTIFIFFTLSIDFGKLNYGRLKFVFAFLFQYFIGLWCVLFIIRYVLLL